ncbi:GGDEF domain-containing protein [Shewanella sp. Isolate11]|uniref:GGDEF domain-containing protein n=1 Tax=Shewanella sp. Isolate11 TaxID=2908530 RepID=UPI001EFEC742|nr:GGDEF domain-containing protein [Shewanella sp. Isolate11]MCG9695614.1 GGDEF domain-containing protein [Shewanella sp. Isolate11]
MPIALLPQFLSIKWKLLLGVVSILTLVGGLMAGFAYYQLLGQQKVLLESQRDQLALGLSSSINTAIEHSFQAAMQLAFVANHNNAQGAEAYRNMLQQDWLDIQLYWGLRSFSLYSLDGIELAHAGQPLTENDLAWILSSEASYESTSRVICVESCVIQMLIPTLVNSKPHLFLFESTLSEVLRHFPIDSNIELAVLGKRVQPESQEQFWQRNLYSISNHPSNYSVLRYMADHYDWPQVISADTIFEFNELRWAVWAFPLDKADNSPEMVVLVGLEQWQLMLEAFQQGMLGTLLLGLLLASGFILLMVWRPVRRLAKHANLLPLLAEHDFDAVRADTPQTKGFIPDEIDLIHQATHKLALKMEGLENDADQFTQELQRQAMLDPLTGLPNKSMLVSEVQKAIACIGVTKEKLVLLFLNLDEFKRINDTLGHIQGDELLKIISARLNNSVREVDTVFRQGGDEFLILLRQVQEEHEVRTLIHRIFASLQYPVVLGSHKLIVTTSIGVAYCDEPTLAAETLIQYAGLAMYQAKRAGRSNFRVFDHEIGVAKLGS